MTKRSLEVEGVTNSLWNEDTTPVDREDRTGSAARAGTLLAAMAVSLPAYLYASCLAALGVSVAGVLGSVVLGSLLVMALAIGCGDAGVRYGVPFAVLARMAFGVLGARVPVILGLLVGCAWVGIGCWLGASAVSRAFDLLGPFAPDRILWLCFALFLVAVAAPWRRIGSPFAAVVCGACLLLILVLSSGIGLKMRGWTMFAPNPSMPVWPRMPGSQSIVLGVTAMMGLWLPVAMGAADGARRIRSSRAFMGSLGAIPVAAVLFSGVVALVSRLMGGGLYVWDLTLLEDGFVRLPFAVGCLLGLAAVALLTARAVCGWLAGEIVTSVSGQVPAAAARGLVALAAVLAMPWWWVASPERYLGVWLTGCAGLLAPVAVVLLVEYFVLRRRWLNVDDLYQRDGLYEYTGGWNWKAFGAVAAGWVVMGIVVAAPSLAGWREGAVWIGTGVSAALYWVLRSGPPDVAQIPPTPLLIPLVGFESEGASG